MFLSPDLIYTWFWFNEREHACFSSQRTHTFFRQSFSQRTQTLFRQRKQTFCLRMSKGAELQSKMIPTKKKKYIHKKRKKKKPGDVSKGALVLLFLDREVPVHG